MLKCNRTTKVESNCCKDKMNLKKVRIIAADLALIALVAMPLVGFAQLPDTPGGLTDRTGGGVLKLIETIATWIAVIFFAVAVIFIIIAAFGYLTSGGDAEKVASAKNKIVFVIVAIVVAALAFAVPRLVFNVLGFQEITPTVGQ